MENEKGFSVNGFEAHIGRLTRSRSAALRANLPPVQVNKSKRNSSESNHSSNLGVFKGKSNKFEVGFGENSQNLRGKSKKDEVLKGRSKKLGSDQDSRIGVSKGDLKKLGSDENTEIEISSNFGGEIGKGRMKRPALGEITNISGANLKLKRLDLEKGKGKRPALDELGFPNKKRLVSKDGIENVLSAGKYKLSFPVPKSQTKVFQKGIMGICKANNKKGLNAKLPSSLSHINSFIQINNEINSEREKDDVIFLEESNNNNNDFNPKEGEKSISSSIINIDEEKSNTLLCTDYASDVYYTHRSIELIRRPCSNFMETLQKDITQNMRAILIDWLVEVCDEYRLVPDTLYLTVYLIDRFLSLNYIERQKLQLVGITCMLIASKYEEICAPRVDEFCFITDNTYNRNQVLKMEREVLSILGYTLSVPTVKTFLRRFLRAAQASSKSEVNMMHLTNYLAELTLVEYNMMKYLPSEIAASAVFLARWTLDQSDHPWNETLEHYTTYKSCDLRASILSLRELQLNTQNCTLKAVRDKYKHEKFESVANLTSPELLEFLFC